MQHPYDLICKHLPIHPYSMMSTSIDLNLMSRFRVLSSFPTVPILLRHISFSTSLRALAARPRTHATALHCTSVPLYLRHPRTKALAIAWKWSVHTHTSRAPERVWVRIGRNEEGRSVSFGSAQEYCSCEASALYPPLRLWQRLWGQFT